MLAVLKALRRRIRLKSLRPSFKQNLLRIPGGSLLRALDNLNEQIHLYLVYVIILPLILYSALISYAYFRVEQVWLPVIWISAIIGSLVCAYLIFNLAKLSSRRKRIRLAYEGELAVGQELNHLMAQGYLVYHDFPADNRCYRRCDLDAARPEKNPTPASQYHCGFCCGRQAGWTG